MDNIGLDLHKRESQLCILTEAGSILERRIVTDRDRFTAVLGGRPPAGIRGHSPSHATARQNAASCVSGPTSSTCRCWRAFFGSEDSIPHGGSSPTAARLGTKRSRAYSRKMSSPENPGRFNSGAGCW
jgi:hypothetical protein